MQLHGDIPPGNEFSCEKDPLLAPSTCSTSYGHLCATASCDHSSDSASTGGERGSQGVPAWFVGLKEAFGYKHLVLLFCAQHLLKGFVDSFTGQAEPYMYKAYGVPAPEMQVFQGLIMLPWALKPLIGLWSDLLPLGGYHKAPYFILATVFGASALLFVGLTDGSVPLIVMVLCFFLVALMISTVDLLSEAKYAEKMQRVPGKGPALLTFVWFGLTAGQFVGTLLSGPVIDTLGPRWAYFLSVGPAVVLLVPVFLGFLEEKRVTGEEVVKVHSRFAQEYETSALCVVMFLASSGLLAVGTCVESMAWKTALTFVVFLAVLGSFSVVLSPVIAKFNAFSLIQSAMSLRINAAAYYFYTDSPEQYPEGPHFSPYFYNTVLGGAGAAVSLIGIATYQRYLSEMPYRRLLLIANVGYSFFSLLDAVLFARLNREIGIPDSAFVLGSSTFEGVISQWQWMPQVVILSYFCPSGMEATMYALLAGCHNLGSTISATFGAWLLHTLSVSPRGAIGDSKEFENLWIASIITTVVPVATVLLLFRLVPDVRQSQSLMQGSPTEGSICKRWL